MPVKVPDNLPAKNILEQENIFIMNESRAFSQDIRPLKIAILNLMPIKEATEVDLLRILSDSPLQIEITFLHMESHISKNTPKEHLATFYKVIDDISGNKYDGLIITGAPIEHLEFEDVAYWKELKKIMEWSKTNVTSTLHICWGAQAGLYYHYGIDKYTLDEKLSGVFKHSINNNGKDISKGFDDEFFVPHSRNSYNKKSDIEKVKELKIISESEEAGVYIIINNNGRQVFATGHSEYNAYTLRDEYNRDLGKGLDTKIPNNYFKDDNPRNEPVVKWRSHAKLFYHNWLNYYVYQETPYDIEKIK